LPKVAPAYRVNSILTVLELVALGLGVGVLPPFLAKPCADLLHLTDVLDECQTELWLLTHTHRVAPVAARVDAVWPSGAGAAIGLTKAHLRSASRYLHGATSESGFAPASAGAMMLRAISTHSA